MNLTETNTTQTTRLVCTEFAACRFFALTLVASRLFELRSCAFSLEPLVLVIYLYSCLPGLYLAYCACHQAACVALLPGLTLFSTHPLVRCLLCVFSQILIAQFLLCYSLLSFLLFIVTFSFSLSLCISNIRCFFSLRHRSPLSI